MTAATSSRAPSFHRRKSNAACSKSKRSRATSPPSNRKVIDQADADAQFAGTLNERPGRLSTFERALLLLADRYGHRVTTSQLAADPNDPARFTFQLAVEITPVAWRAYGDNRGTERAGPEQLLGWLGFNSLTGADRLAAQLFIAPTSTKELTFGDVNYARAWSQGALWTEIGASASRARDGGRPAILATVSEVERLYGRATLPLIRTRAQSLWTHLAFDARNTEEYDPLGPDADEATRVVRVSANYTMTLGDTRGDAMVELSQGLNAFGASENGDTALTRLDGRPQFTKARLDAAATHRFSDRWEIAIAGAGQPPTARSFRPKNSAAAAHASAAPTTTAKSSATAASPAAPNCAGAGATPSSDWPTCSSTSTPTPCASGTSASTPSNSATTSFRRPAAACASRRSQASWRTSKWQNPCRATSPPKAIARRAFSSRSRSAGKAHAFTPARLTPIVTTIFPLCSAFPKRRKASAMSASLYGPSMTGRSLPCAKGRRGGQGLCWV